AVDDPLAGRIDRETVDGRPRDDPRVDLLFPVVGPADRIPVVVARDDEALHEPDGVAARPAVHEFEAELERLRIPDPHRDVLAARRPRAPARVDGEIAKPVVLHLDLPERLAAVAAAEEQRTVAGRDEQPLAVGR